MKKNTIIKSIVGIVIICSMFMLLFFFHTSPTPDTEPNGKLTVVTTLFPLYDFARNIGGNHVDVTLLLPSGMEAHTFEPTPHDMITIDHADLFIYTGKFMEPWANEIHTEINAHVRIVDTSAHILLMNEHADEGDTSSTPTHDNEPNANDIRHSTGVDPHIWLDLDNAQIMVDTITEAFIQEDPDHAHEYRTNALTYKKQLVDLNDRYARSLETCATRTIVYGGHYAFGYLGRKFDLSYESAYGISPDAEPSAQDLAKLIEQVRTHHISTIFYEELLNDRVAQTIANETGAQLLSLHPAHNITKDQYRDGISFLAIMEHNLQNLIQGLSCK